MEKMLMAMREQKGLCLKSKTGLGENFPTPSARPLFVLMALGLKLLSPLMLGNLLPTFFLY
jgi:hypothetical protein